MNESEVTRARLARLGRSLPPFPLTDAQKEALRHAQDEEQAAMKLLMVMTPRLADVVQAEVERRTAVFLQVRESSPVPPVVWPRQAAIESVTADLIAGRL